MNVAASCTWFIPLKDAKPWKQPLQERHANAVRTHAWPQMDATARNAINELLSRKTDSLGRVWSEYLPSHLPLDEEEEKKAVGLKVSHFSCLRVFSYLYVFPSHSSARFFLCRVRSNIACRFSYRNHVNASDWSRFARKSAPWRRRMVAIETPSLKLTDDKWPT